MNLDQLAKTANEMVADDRGLLAADESTSTIGKRLDSIGAENTEDNRRDYRELLFRAEGLGKSISGAILYDETLRQSAADGASLVSILQGQGIIPGIKVDTGAKELPGSQGEKITEGLDGLPARVEEYVGLGARYMIFNATAFVPFIQVQAGLRFYNFEWTVGGGETDGRIVRFTPKGLSVISLQRLISLSRSSGVGWVRAVMMPRPPALDTAAASSA